MKTVFLSIANFLFWTGVALWIPVALFLNVFWGWGEWFSPTLGQHVFLAVGTGFVPSLAIVGYLATNGIKRFAKAAALLGCGVVGLGVAAGFAIVAYPRYPDRGPHELIASAMVLPAIAFPIGIIAAWRRFKFPPKAWLFCSAWACLVLGATIPSFKREIDMALPLSAPREALGALRYPGLLELLPSCRWARCRRCRQLRDKDGPDQTARLSRLRPRRTIGLDPAARRRALGAR